MAKKEKLVLIDSFALIFRAYYAFPPNLTLEDGTPSNAAYGFATLLLDIISKLKPDHLIAVFDSKGPVIRQSDFVLYKANRKEADKEFLVQIPLVRNILDAFDIPILNVEGYEADDIIGTIDEKHSGSWAETIIVTGDQDLFQLVDDDTLVYLAARKFSESSLFDAKKVKEKLGIRPDQVIDYKAICGDSSDNIPGVPGIGKKGAVDLLSQFDSLSYIFDRVEEVPNRYQKKLQENYELAIKSKELATIHKNVPISFDFKNAKFQLNSINEIVRLFEEYRFKSLLNKTYRLAEEYNIKMGNEDNSNDKQQIHKVSEYKKDIIKDKIFLYPKIANLDKFSSGWDVDYIFLASAKGDLYKIESNQIEQFIKDIKVTNADIYSLFLKELSHALLNKNISIIDQLDEFKIKDLLFYGYLAGEGRVKNDLQKQLEFYNVSFIDTSEESLTLSLQKLSETIDEKLEEEKELLEVIRLEHKVLPVVIEMERSGIILNKQSLKDIEDFLNVTKDTYEQEIYSDVGHEFNINSPKQVGEVLFAERDLPGGKKTKTGSFSTNERILSKLVDVDPVVEKILLFREIQKLLSTYVKALPVYIEKDGRVHATFDQLGAVSGRFSSKNPNLQNIPTSNSFDLSIRSAFEAEKKSILIGFDYAQQELRILAALAKEEKLIRSFNEGKDIHKLTASEMFEKHINDVTKEERNIGKTINFSIIYGISAFGLSDRMNIDRNMAKDFIDKYFERYTKIAEYFESMKSELLKNNRSRTYLGRARSNEGVMPKNRFAREAIERELINFRIQGTAADIMKIALLKCKPILERYDAKLLLQIHDEYLFEYNVGAEVEESEESYRALIKSDKKLASFIKEINTAMSETIDLGVRYDISVKMGLNWGNLIEID